jgi:Predicted transcriptional regulators
MRIRKKNDSLDDMSKKELESIAKVSDALAHPVRLELFRYIMQSNKSMNTVCTKDLVAEFDYAQATISQHMKKLVQSGLIEVKKQDKFSYYYVNLGILMQYIDNVKKYSIM